LITTIDYRVSEKCHALKTSKVSKTEEVWAKIFIRTSIFLARRLAELNEEPLPSIDTVVPKFHYFERGYIGNFFVLHFTLAYNYSKSFVFVLPSES
jgi:hypothetical protein